MNMQMGHVAMELDGFYKYYYELLGDVYPQPEDDGHTRMAGEVINKWVSILSPCKSVLDVGAGQGFCQPFFEQFGIHYTGIAMGKDVIEAKKLGRNVLQGDFHFLSHHADASYDLIFSRHSLEHSPMPLIALMEWYRLASNWLCLILPNPIHYGWVGKNHYSVLHPDQAKFLMERAGWRVIWEDNSEETELRYMAEKKSTRFKEWDK